MKEIQHEIYRKSGCKDGSSGGLDKKLNFNNFEN